jgi:hypothetical protein
MTDCSQSGPTARAVHEFDLGPPKENWTFKKNIAKKVLKNLPARRDITHKGDSP